MRRGAILGGLAGAALGLYIGIRAAIATLVMHDLERAVRRWRRDLYARVRRP
jgi:hypothetical protein